MELDPASATTYFIIGWARWDAGDRDGGLVAMRRSVELDPESLLTHRGLGMMEATLGNRAEGVTHVRLAERLDPNRQRSNVITAYAYRVAGLHDDAARVARAWAAMFEELPRRPTSVLYHLVFDEEEQALDALALLLEIPTALSPPVTNAYDDPILDKPEFAALRAELRAKIGWN